MPICECAFSEWSVCPSGMLGFLVCGITTSFCYILTFRAQRGVRDKACAIYCYAILCSISKEYFLSYEKSIKEDIR